MKKILFSLIFCFCPHLVLAAGLGQLLAQSNPPAATLTSIYTAPPTMTGGVLCTTIWVANRDTVAHTFRIAVASQGAADDLKQYLYYNIALAGGSSFVQSVALPLSSGDVVRVYDDAQQLTFSLYGTTQP